MHFCTFQNARISLNNFSYYKFFKANHCYTVVTFVVNDKIMLHIDNNKYTFFQQ